jgi:hypothetical protein
MLQNNSGFSKGFGSWAVKTGLNCRLEETFLQTAFLSEMSERKLKKSFPFLSQQME